MRNFFAFTGVAPGFVAHPHQQSFASLHMLLVVEFLLVGINSDQQIAAKNS